MSGEWRVSLDYGGKVATRSPDAAIAQIAGAQHGVVARAQLRELGLGEKAIEYRIRKGSLHFVHRGVYAVGHASITPQGRYIAGVLACGDGAVLGVRSAAAFRGLRVSAPAQIEVIVPRAGGRAIAGISPHRMALREEEWEVVEAIRVTTIARTLFDLAAAVPSRVLERAFDQAEVLRMLDVTKIEQILDRNPRSRGTATLRAVLNDHQIATTITRSDLEERLLALIRRAELPQPKVNFHVPLLDGTLVEVDFCWPEQRLIVEADGRAFHDTTRAFDHDRERDAELTLAGWRVVHVTWRHVTREAARTERRLRGLLLPG
jgi:very-short-patch-repair endonuclease